MTCRSDAEFHFHFHSIPSCLLWFAVVGFIVPFCSFGVSKEVKVLSASLLYYPEECFFSGHSLCNFCVSHSFIIIIIVDEFLSLLFRLSLFLIIINYYYSWVEWGPCVSQFVGVVVVVILWNFLRVLQLRVFGHILLSVRRRRRTFLFLSFSFLWRFPTHHHRLVSLR